jgi:tetratricopeptide (TPR) repeat protein
VIHIIRKLAFVFSLVLLWLFFLVLLWGFVIPYFWPHTARDYFFRGLHNLDASNVGNKNDSVIADFNKAIELCPNLTDAYLNRGIVYTKKGHHDLAIADFKKVIELDPKYALAYINLGSLLEGKHTAEAIEVYRNLIKNAPEEQIFVDRAKLRIGRCGGSVE